MDPPVTTTPPRPRRRQARRSPNSSSEKSPEPAAVRAPETSSQQQAAGAVNATRGARSHAGGSKAPSAVAAEAPRPGLRAADVDGILASALLRALRSLLAIVLVLRS